MTTRRRRVDPGLSAKRAEAGRRGAAARWGHDRVTNHGNDQAIPVPVLNGKRGTRKPAPQGDGNWFRIENKASAGPAEVYIYDEIGYFGTTAAEFVDELNELETDTIDLHINSPGGDVFPALAIFNALVEHDAQVHVFVDGLAASAASFIAQAGDKVTMAANATMMIHDAFGVCVGNADDMAQMQARLDRVSGNLASLYAARTGEGSTADWREAMKAETWYTGAEAVEAGLADDVAAKSQDKRSGTVDDEATNRWDLSMFRHAGRAEAPAPTIRPANRHAPAAGDTIPVSGPGADSDEESGSTASESGPAGNAPATEAAAAEPAATDDEPPAGEPEPPPAAELDPFADVPDDAFAGIAAALEDTFTDAFELDPEVLRASVADAYDNAPAPPATTRPAPPALSAIALDAIADALADGTTPAAPAEPPFIDPDVLRTSVRDAYENAPAAPPPPAPVPPPLTSIALEEIADAIAVGTQEAYQ